MLTRSHLRPSERAVFESVHGLLAELIEEIEKVIPSLTLNRVGSVESGLDEAERTANELSRKFDRLDELDSLEQIEKELGDSGPGDSAGVPARRKPGPGGQTGGIALTLPDHDTT